MKEIMMMKGAKIILETCANVTPGEKTLIVTDPERMSIAKVLGAALVERGIEPVISVMLPRELDGQEPPSLISAALLEADIIFLPVSVSIAHSTAIKRALEKGARVLSLAGFTEEQLYKGGILANFKEQRKVCEHFTSLFTEASEIKITSMEGTDFSASIKGRTGNSQASIVDKPGQLAGAVNIEANVSPIEETAQGVIVVDGSIPNFDIGLVTEHIKLYVENGLITKIIGGKEARFLDELLKRQADPTVYNIAQIAIGLNPEVKRLTGVLTNDHGAFGRVHIGIGTSTQLGGTVKAPIHFDVVMDAPTLEFDKKILLKNGVFINL